MKNFSKEYKRISASDLPQEIHMGVSAIERCGDCFHPLGMKAKPVGLDKGIFTIYCPNCKKEFEQIELADEELLEFLVEYTTRLILGGAA